MMSFLLKIVGNGAAFYIATYFVEGFTFTGNIVMLAWIGLLITLGYIAKSILGFITLPLSFLSLGLFSVVLSLVINAGIVLGLAIALESVQLAGISALIGAVFILAIASAVLNTTLRIILP